MLEVEIDVQNMSVSNIKYNLVTNQHPDLSTTVSTT